MSVYQYAQWNAYNPSEIGERETIIEMFGTKVGQMFRSAAIVRQISTKASRQVDRLVVW